MKTKLFTVLALIILTITGFVLKGFKIPSPEEVNAPTHQQTQTNNRWLDKFYIGAMDADYDYQSHYYQQLHQLGFNLWHTYMGQEQHCDTCRKHPQMSWSGRYDNDRLMTSISGYKDTVNKYIDLISNSGERNLAIMRPKIEWLCHGQRSDYKCAYIPTNSELWFYSFQSPNHTGSDIPDNSIYGNGQMVRYCNTIPSNPDPVGYVVSRLKANTEQCNQITDPTIPNHWFGDSECDWIIKPRIRIPSDFVIPVNYETPVCSIKVLAQDGFTIKTTAIIKAKYFLNSQSQYDGSYIEDYNFGAEPNTLTFHGDLGYDWMYKARGDHPTDLSTDNHADIQVYWYGNCDMWIDYVRVDNDVASDLLSTNPNNIMHQLYDQWIIDEVTQIGNHIPQGTTEPAIIKYYLELTEFNNIPCMAYVDSILHTIPGAPDLMQDLHNWLFYHVPLENAPSVSNAVFLNHQYIQKVGFTQIFAECYPLNACFRSTVQNTSKIPNTLPVISGEKILAQAVSPSEYDSWLRDNMNHRPYYYRPESGDNQCSGYGLPQELGHFRFKMQLCDSLSKLANIPFIYMAQAHQWYYIWEVRREPTDEELQMMANVAVSYGVKGILYYMYISFIDQPAGVNYGTGLTEPNVNTLRQENYYQQENPNKIETIQNITNRLVNKWGPYLLSFNNADRHSYIYDDETERTNFLSSTYFKEIRTNVLDPTTNCADLKQNTNYENPNSTYIQAATFKKDGEQYTNYFMLVNRRCSPGDDDCSGRRFVTVLFDSISTTEFSGFKNWKIIDLYNDSTVSTFDKRISNPISLGKYKPGEG